MDAVSAEPVTAISVWAQTLSIVLATIVGPIAAVLITRWRDARAELRNRRMAIFRTLMATRRIAITNEHVGALNLVEIEFYGVKPIEQYWREYIEHLSSPYNPNEEQARRWEDLRADKLAKLLSQIAVHLKMPIGEIDLRNGGYAPEGWAYRENRQARMEEYFIDLSTGRKCVPVFVVTPSQPDKEDGANAGQGRD